MARSISVIKQQILDQIAAQPALAGLTSNSQVAIWNNIAFVTAVCINLFEQVLDIFKTEIESDIGKAGVGAKPWLRAQILKFQYSATNPQFVELDPITLEIAYPTIDPTLQILTRAAIVENGTAPLTIKVAKSEPPVALVSGEITALKAFIKEFQFSGKQINVVTANADSLIVVGAIYYDGQYSSTIQQSVEDALNNYCSSLSSVDNFGSAVKLTDVQEAILSVQGVSDVDLTEVSVRPDGTAIGSRYKIYELSSGTNNRQFDTVSGYIVEETTSSWTFADTLTYTAV